MKQQNLQRSLKAARTSVHKTKFKPIKPGRNCRPSQLEQLDMRLGMPFNSPPKKKHKIYQMIQGQKYFLSRLGKLVPEVSRHIDE